MLEIARLYHDLAVAQYGVLERTLTGITPDELDWRIHDEANTIRWILGHHLWFETWLPDAIEDTGRFRSDRAPLSLPIASVGQFAERFEAAMRHRVAVYERLREADLSHERDYFGRDTYNIARLLRTHPAHFTGHSWQARFIRAVHSRAHETDKRAFDPF